MLTHSSIVVAIPEQVSSDLLEESVILDLKSGVYYGLNEVGSGIWKFIQKPRPVSEIVAKIIHSYEVEVDQCKQDIMQLLEQLLEAKLIKICDEENS